MGQEDRRGLTGNPQGFYTDSMAEGVESSGGARPRVLLRRPDGQSVPLPPRSTPPEVVAERTQAQLQYEQMMRQAAEAPQTPEERPREPENGDILRLVLQEMREQRDEQSEVFRALLERDRQRDEELRELREQRNGQQAETRTPPAPEGEPQAAQTEQHARQEDMLGDILDTDAEVAAALGLDDITGRRRRGERRDSPEGSFLRIREALRRPEVREKEKRDAALEMKRWARIVIENVENGNLIFKTPPEGERGKERILREYIDLNVYDPSVSMQELAERIQELRGVVGIERYFANVAELDPSPDGMPTCSEEMLHSLANKWGQANYGTGEKAELISRDGIVNDKNVLDLFVERARVVTGNNPRGRVNYNRLIFFGNRLRTEEMDDALNNPEYLARRSYEIISNEAERDAEGNYIVPDGEETIETREIRVPDPRFEKLMGYSYYNFLYYFVVAHNRERAQWRTMKATKDGAMGALKQMFNVEGGNDYAARNGLEMIWRLPNPENADEVKEWIDGKERGSFGLFGQRLNNAMDALLEAHPPEDSKALDTPVVIERLPNGKTMFEEVLGEEGVKTYYRVWAEALLSRTESFKQIYTEATAKAIEALKGRFPQERAQTILTAKVTELQKKKPDELLAIEWGTNQQVKDTLNRILKGEPDSEELITALEKEVVAAIQRDLVNSIQQPLANSCRREVRRIQTMNSHPDQGNVHEDILEYRQRRIWEYMDVEGKITNMAGNYTAKDMEAFAKAAALSANVPWEELNPSYDKNLPGPELKAVADKALVEASNVGVNLPDHVKEYAGRFYVDMRGWMFYEAKNHHRAIYPFMTSAMHAEQDVTERKARGGRPGGGNPIVRPWFKHMVAPYPYSIGVDVEVNGVKEKWSLAEVLRGTKDMRMDYSNIPGGFTTPIEAESDWYQMLEGQIATKEMVGKSTGVLDIVSQADGKFVIDEGKWDEVVNGNLRRPTRSGYSTYVGPWYYDQKIRATDPREKVDDRGRRVRIVEIKTKSLADWEFDARVKTVMDELGIKGRDEGIYITALMGELAYKTSSKYKGKKIDPSDFQTKIRIACTATVAEGKPLMSEARYVKMMQLLGIFNAKGEISEAFVRSQQGQPSMLQGLFSE